MHGKNRCCFKPGLTEDVKSMLQGRWIFGEVIWKIKYVTGMLREKFEGKYAAFTAALLLCLLEPWLSSGLSR